MNSNEHNTPEKLIGVLTAAVMCGGFTALVIIGIVWVAKAVL